MQGEHLGMPAVSRAELRRQARQVQRIEAPHATWDGDVPLWLAASHVPGVLRRRRDLERIAPGCYRVGPAWFSFVWIAANELPLREELIPFLIARSGQALDEFGRWVKDWRPPEWLVRMLTGDEHRMLHDRLQRLGPERLGDVVLDFGPQDLAAWLADAGAR